MSMTFFYVATALESGLTILRLSAHGNAVEVGDWTNMVPVLDTIIAAVAAGELDAALTPSLRPQKTKSQRARRLRVA